MKKRIKILHIHKRDAHFGSRKQYLGKTGYFELQDHRQYVPTYFSGDFYPDDRMPNSQCYFLAVRYKKI